MPTLVFSKLHSMQKDITSMTEAHGANGVPSMEEIRTLFQQAEKGDKQVLPALRKLLDHCPALSACYGSLAQTAREALIKCIGGEKNLAVQECYTRMLDAMGQELSGPASSPLERLLVERIVMCWLHLYYTEALYVQNMQDLTLRQSEFHQKRITMAHNRYLSALRTLAQVRRLKVPAVQVNIGEQQVNVA
jgi:hypothetical protein